MSFGSARRGNNQSTSTKYAATLLADALDLLDSGRVGAAREQIVRSLVLLPMIDAAAQRMAEVEYIKQKRGLAA